MSKALLLRVSAVAVMALFVACGGGDDGGEPLLPAEAESELLKKVAAINWTEGIPPQVGPLPDGEPSEIADALPPIDEFSLVVQPQASGNDVVVEIFASTEKSSEGTDGWIVEVAEEFNRESRPLASGRVWPHPRAGPSC